MGFETRPVVRRWHLGAVGLAAALALGVPTHAGEGPPAPQLVPSVLDLGEWAAGKVTRGAVWLINPTEQVLQITAATANDQRVTVTDFAPATVQPSSAVQLWISVQMPDTPGLQVEGEVNFACSPGPSLVLPVVVHTIHPDVHLPAPWLDEQAESPLKTAPPRLRLPDAGSGQRRQGTAWLINPGEEPVRVLAAKPSCGCMEITGFGPLTLEPKRIAPVTIKMYANNIVGQERIKHATFILEGFSSLVMPVHLKSIDPKLASVRRLIEAEQNRDAVAMRRELSADATVWYGRRGAPGSDRSGNLNDRWTPWSAAMNLTRYHDRFMIEDDHISTIVTEMSDIHELTKQPPTTQEVRFFFNADGEIEGVLYERTPAEVGQFVMKSCTPFREWLAGQAPELTTVVDLDASADPPPVELAERWRVLLQEWKDSNVLSFSISLPF